MKKKLLKTSALLILMLFTGLLLECNLSFAQKSLAKGLGKLITKKSGNLEEIVAEARYITNLCPQSLMKSDGYYQVFDKTWKEGGALVAVFLWKMEGLSIIELEGKVMIDGEEVPYLGLGAYGKLVDGTKPVTVAFESKTGQKAEFSVKPTVSISITSPTEGQEVNLKNDLALILQNPNGCEGTGVRTAILSSNTWKTIGYASSADELKISANGIKARTMNQDIMNGNNTLMVERYALEELQVNGLGKARAVSLSWDTQPIKTTGFSMFKAGTSLGKEKDGVRADPVLGISIERNMGKAKQVPYQMGYWVKKLYGPSLSRPLTPVKKLAPISFIVRATALTQEESNTWTSQNVDIQYNAAMTEKTIITTTTTHKETCKKNFPQFDKQVWDNLTEELYKGLEQTLKQQGIDLIPVEQVLNAKSYQNFLTVDDTLTDEVYHSSYKGLKKINAKGISGKVMALFGAPQKKLIKELGVDGTVSVTIEFAMPFGACDKVTTLMPKFTYSILGTPIGWESFQAAPPIAEGEIKGDGVDIKKFMQTIEVTETNAKGKEKKVKKDVVSPDCLKDVIRKEAIFEALKESLTRMKEEETKLGY